MAGTRQSTRNSSPPNSTPTNGTKRKADEASPTSNKKKQQKTLEEVIPDETKREEVKAALRNEDNDEESTNGVQNEFAENETKQESDEPNAFDKVHADENDEGKTGAKVSLLGHYGLCPAFC